VSALAVWIEDEGLPTVTISLVREHSQAMQPPRALWVPFILGRPFGVPDDPVFQRRVLSAANDLFGRERGPVLEDYPVEAPEADDDDHQLGLACPISFPQPEIGQSLPDQVKAEIVQLRSWYDLHRARRGRTSFGLSGHEPEQLAVVIGSAAGLLATEDLPQALQLRLACEDLKTFYLESRLAQPGHGTAETMQRWFWFETAAGRLLFELADATADSPDPDLRHFSEKNLLPRLALDGPQPGRSLDRTDPPDCPEGGIFGGRER